MSTLWALETPSDYIACPSSEAALAVCGPEDRVAMWPLDKPFHELEVAHFLSNLDVPEVLQ